MDSSADADLYLRKFDGVCDAIADVLGGPDVADLELANLNKGEE